MADNISLPKILMETLMPNAITRAAMEEARGNFRRRSKWWKEGYKAGTIKAALPQRCPKGYMAGYEAGLVELDRLMNLDDRSDELMLPRRSLDNIHPDKVCLSSKRPPALDKWGAYAVGRDCKARCILSREDMISLLGYVLLLERRVAELEPEAEAEESFW